MATVPQDPSGAGSLWNDLWTKQQALYDYLQTLNTSLMPADRPNYAGDIGNAQYEIERIGAILDLLDNNRPIPFPSDDQVVALRSSVGALQQAVTRGAAVAELVAAASAVVSTWPLSNGG